MHFGIDIGAFSIKTIQAQKKGNKFVLQHWAEVRTPVAIEAMEQKDRVALAEIIKKMVSEARMESSNVVAALSETKVYSRVIQMPVLTDAELASAIEFEAEQYIPLPAEQVQLEYIVLNKPARAEPGAKMEVLLIAAQKKAVNEIVQLLEMIGLVPLALETEVLAMTRSLAVFSDTSLLLNIGRDTTDLIIVQGPSLKFVYSFPVGGATLTRSIAQTLSLDIVQAEEYKKAYGLDKTVLEGKVAQAMEPAFLQIVQQTQKAINFYTQKSPSSIKRLILAGGTAEMPGISTFLTQVLGLESVLGNPFYTFDKDKNFPPALNKVSARFATAVGLAMRET